MKTWFGSYYDSPAAEAVEVTVLAVEKKITIGFRNSQGVSDTRSWEINYLHANYNSSLQASRITNENEPRQLLVIKGKEAMEFITAMQAEHNKAWYKKDKARGGFKSIAVLLAILLVLTIAYFLMVPWLSEKMASQVSIQTEEQFGNAVYDALSLSAQEDVEQSATVNEFFKAMRVPTSYNIHITVVKSEIVNAFALPGGHIVVYTGLLQQLKTYPELAALLSHEFIHVNNRHSTKNIFRQLGSRIFLSLLFGKFGAVTSVMVDQADNLKSLTYSRSLEKEADTEGLILLKERKIDPAGFIQLFEQLKTAPASSELPEFLGSHPDTDNRMDYIRKESENAIVEESSELKTIFAKLKTEL